MNTTAQRLSPIARAAAIACLGLAANSAIAAGPCAADITTLDSASCTMSAGQSVTISNTGSVTANLVGGTYELAIDANGDASVLTIDAGGFVNGFIGVTGAPNGIDLINNAGEISGGLVGISVDIDGSISAIDNSGTISADAGITASNEAFVQDITNTGTISGLADDGVGLYSLGNTTLTLSNTGSGATISGNGAGFAGVHVSTAINSITNSGAIEGLSGASGIAVEGSVVSIDNAAGGTITGGLAGIFVDTGGSVGSITNAGTITGGSGPAIDLSLAAGATTVNNTGAIDGNVLLGNGTLNLNGDVGYVVGDVSGNVGSVVHVNGTSTSGGSLDVGNFTIASGGVFNLGHALTTSGALTNAGILNLDVGSSVSGAIAGTGDVNVNTDMTTQGSVAGRLLSIATGITLDAGHEISVSDALNNEGALLLNVGARVNGAITGNGTVDVNTNITTQGTLGAGLLTIAATKTLNAGHAITVNELANAGSLHLNAGARVIGAITGSGDIQVNTDFTTEGSVNAGLIAIATAKALTAQHPVTATAFTNAGTLNIAAGQTVSADSYTQLAGGVLKVGASNTANPGTLEVTGIADFSASGAIAVNVGAGDTLAENDVLRIVTAGTLASPTLYSVTDNSASWNFSALDNGANGIDLTVHFSSPTNAVQLASQPAAAGAADAISAVLSGSVPASMQPLADILNAQNNQVALGNQIAQLTPVLSGNQGAAALSAINAGASSLVQNQLTSTMGMASGDVVLAQHVWLKPFGSSLKQDASSDGLSGYKAATSGVAVGADGKIGRFGWRGGAALSYGNTKVDDTGTNQGTLDISSWQFTGYGSHRIDAGTQFNLVGGVGYNDNKSTRVVPMLATTYTGKFNSWHVLLDAELEWAKKLSETNTLIPSLRLSYGALNSDAYTETPSGNAALQVASSTTNALVLGFGTKFVRQQGALGRLIAHVDAGFDLVDKPTTLSSTFEGGGPSFSTPGATPGRTSIKAGVGYQQTLSNGSEVTARFDTEWRQLFAGNSLSLNWRHAF